jgi:hypothetical protein
MDDTAKTRNGFHGKPGRSGPRERNQNATRHGMRGSKLPPGCKYIELQVNSLRRQIEEAVMAAKGEITITDAAAINSILKWERHGKLANHWLRKECDKLSASDRLRFSEAIAKASDYRDRNIRLLGLDRDQHDDLMQELYGRRKPKLLPAPKEEAS